MQEENYGSPTEGSGGYFEAVVERAESRSEAFFICEGEYEDESSEPGDVPGSFQGVVERLEGVEHPMRNDR